MLSPLLFLFLTADPVAVLTDWYGRIAAKQLDQREAEIRAIQNKEQAEARKRRTRELVLQSLGGLPEYKGPLNARVAGAIDADGYRIEKLSFESLPRFVVTANLYVPKTPGKHPTVLFAVGHWDQGKPFAQRIAGNLARKGFVVLAYDPIGQGERPQAYETRSGRSLIGNSVEQHMMTGALNLMIGEGEMRYFVNDSARALDYLETRPEVDAERIGMTGCSGGGTVTTFVAALDARIKVAASSCYIQTFRALVPGPTGDSEQSNPNFVALGLDQGDLVELFSPKPFLMTSTEQDFFVPGSAKAVFDEAQRWYGMYGADDRAKWVVGPGEHGTPLVVREAIYAWMLRWLAKDAKTSSKEEDLPLLANQDFWVTPKGVLDGQSTRDLYEVVGERMRSRQSPADLVAYLKKWTAESEPDPELSIEVLPAQGTPTGRGVLFVVKQWEMTQRAKDLAAAGNVVMMMRPRGLPHADPRAVSFGDGISGIRAALVGRNLPLLRARDVMRAVERLARLDGVREIHAEAYDVAGYWLLAAAALEPRIASVRLTMTPWSLRGAFSAAVSKRLYDVAMPEFALHWDTQDLVDAVRPRKVVWVDPADWNQNVIAVKGSGVEYTKEAQ